MHTPKKSKREPNVDSIAPDSPKSSEVEQDKGYGPSHGYGPGHGGPSGPGDVPGDATAPAGKKPPVKDDETARPSESGPSEAT